MTNARPTHRTAAGDAYLRLRRVAREHGRLTDEYLRHYVLECFLARLADSPHADKLVIKGGVLLAAYDIRRPTADIDIAARRVSGEVDRIRQIVAAIAERTGPDGVVFDISTAQAEQIRDEDEYAGVRVTMTAQLATARIRFHVDVNIGDPVWPEPGLVRLPRLLGGEIVVRGYPLAMVLAEKIATAHERGIANTRWRDFADVHLLTGGQSVPADVFVVALRTVADHRGIAVLGLADVLTGYAELAQSKWATWRGRQLLADRLPTEFGDVLEDVCAFADIAVEPDSHGLVWQPMLRRWAAT